MCFSAHVSGLVRARVARLTALLCHQYLFGSQSGVAVAPEDRSSHTIGLNLFSDLDGCIGTQGDLLRYVINGSAVTANVLPEQLKQWKW
jgi:hypothetical protein